jgi:hypothetical protein
MFEDVVAYVLVFYLPCGALLGEPHYIVAAMWVVLCP